MGITIIKFSLFVSITIANESEKQYYWVSKPLEGANDSKNSVPDGALKHEESSNTFINNINLQDNSELQITDETVIALSNPLTFAPYPHQQESLTTEDIGNNEDVENPLYIPLQEPVVNIASPVLPTNNKLAQIVAEMKAHQVNREADTMDEQKYEAVPQSNVNNVPLPNSHTSSNSRTSPASPQKQTGKLKNKIQEEEPKNNAIKQQELINEESYENAASVRIAAIMSKSPSPKPDGGPAQKNSQHTNTHPAKRGPPPHTKPKPTKGQSFSSGNMPKTPTAADKEQRSRFLSHPDTSVNQQQQVNSDVINDENHYMTPRSAGDQLPWQPYKELDFMTVDPVNDYAVLSPSQTDVFYSSSFSPN